MFDQYLVHTLPPSGKTKQKNSGSKLRAAMRAIIQTRPLNQLSLPRCLGLVN